MKAEKGRWYREDGTLVYEADLRQAKRDLLYPSVTHLMRQVAEPYPLREWRERQMVMAAATAPRRQDEDDDEYFGRVKAEAYHEGADAAAFGTDLHSRIAAYVARHDGDLPAELAEWIRGHLSPSTRAEMSVVNHDLGYAGTTDYAGMIDGKFGLVDFKTQRVPHRTYEVRRGNRVSQRTDASPTWYPWWCWQLAAYGIACRVPHGDAAFLRPVAFWSVVINTNRDHPRWHGEDRPGVWARCWKGSEMKHAVGAVRVLADLFYTLNDRPGAPFPRPGTDRRKAAELRRPRS